MRSSSPQHRRRCASLHEALATSCKGCCVSGMGRVQGQALTTALQALVPCCTGRWPAGQLLGICLSPKLACSRAGTICQDTRQATACTAAQLLHCMYGQRTHRSTATAVPRCTEPAPPAAGGPCRTAPGGADSLPGCAAGCCTPGAGIGCMDTLLPSAPPSPAQAWKSVRDLVLTRIKEEKGGWLLHSQGRVSWLLQPVGRVLSEGAQGCL